VKLGSLKDKDSCPFTQKMVPTKVLTIEYSLNHLYNLTIYPFTESESDQPVIQIIAEAPIKREFKKQVTEISEAKR
jgi:hypothetical protein